MFQYLLCWRYLRTRYIALASIISVMLGVATLIVVNAVMAGFASKIRTRLHGLLSDVVVESYDHNGFFNSDEVMARIKAVAGDQVEALSCSMETVGMLTWRLPGGEINKQVQIIGVRPEERAQTGDFAEFLIDDKGERLPPSFAVSERLRNRNPAGELLQELPRDNKDPEMAEMLKILQQQRDEMAPEHGAIIGYAIATVRNPETHQDEYLAPLGTKVSLAFPRRSGSSRPEPAYENFTVVSHFKSGMSEYDSTMVYVPLERLQFLRGLIDAQGRGAVNQIHVKVKPGQDIDALRDRLQLALERLRPLAFHVSTWEEKQGPLLAAVAIEQNILNMLLFFIIAVAGFGILATFSMIVVEKTRDIGVLKALGASTGGIRKIFLGYGLALGAVGSGVGVAGGLLFVRYINDIEDWLNKLTGQRVFNPDIYYFTQIPTLVETRTIVWVVAGTLLIAVAASIWPAQRAARLHPVRALRFE